MKKSKISSSASMLMLAFTAAFVPQGGAQIISEDYDSRATGAAPADVLFYGISNSEFGLRPSINTAGPPTILTQVTATNPAGSGNGLELIDDSIADRVGYEVDVVPQPATGLSNLHVSFDIAWNSITPDPGNGVVDPTHSIKMALTGYNGDNDLLTANQTTRFCKIDFNNDGSIDGFSGGLLATSLTDGTSVQVDLFANDSDTDTITYNSPAGGTAMLAPNGLILYLDTVPVSAGSLEDDNGVDPPIALAGDNNIGRFGFSSFNGAFGLSYTIDNLVINEIVASTILLKEDFEGQIEAETPTATLAEPATVDHTLDHYMVTIPESDEFGLRNYAGGVGGGQGVEFLDTQLTDITDGNTALEWALVPSSNMKFSVDFAWVDATDIVNPIAAGGPNDLDIHFAVGGTFDNNLISSSRRDLPARFHYDGRFTIGQGGSGSSIAGSSSIFLVAEQRYNMTVFVNDKDVDSITYEDPCGIIRVLAPNTGDFFLDDVFFGTEEYRDQSETGDPLYPGEDNIRRVGFITNTNKMGGIWVFDNICATAITPATGEAPLFKETFEKATVGLPPNAITPEGVIVVTGAANFAGGGTGNGMQLFDNLYDPSDVLPDASDYQVEIPNSGNYHISFDTAWNDIQTTGPLDPALGQCKVRIGRSGQGMTAGKRSYFDLGLSSKGEVGFLSAGSVVPPATAPTPHQLIDDAPAHIDIFVNDNDTTAVDYPSPAGGTGSLPADSWTAYIDGVHFLTSNFDGDIISDSDSENITMGFGGENLGRLGIVAAGDDVELDYTFDNICITEIPDPSTELIVPAITGIVTTLPDVVDVTFDSVDGNDYDILWSPDIITPFTVVDTVSATGATTTWNRTGTAITGDEYFRVQNVGPTP